MSVLTSILKKAYSEDEMLAMKHRRNLDPTQKMLVGLKDHMYRNPETFEPKPVGGAVAMGALGAMAGGLVGAVGTPTTAASQSALGGGGDDVFRNAAIGAGVSGLASGVLGYLLTARKRDQFQAGRKAWMKV